MEEYIAQVDSGALDELQFNPAGNGEFFATFKGEPADTVTYHGRSYNRADLSAETLLWLESYLALSEEEQLAVSYEPAELRGGELPTTEDAGAEQPAAEEELPPFVPEYDPQVKDSTPASPDMTANTLAVCPVEGCTAWGTHTHDGATYLCSGAHCGGACDGSCAAGVPSGGRHHGAGNGNGHHGNGHHG